MRGPHPDGRGEAMKAVKMEQSFVASGSCARHSKVLRLWAGTGQLQQNVLGSQGERHEDRGGRSSSGEMIDQRASRPRCQKAKVREGKET